MKEWRLVVLLCTALLFVPVVRPQEKWSRPEIADKRVDDWVPITASCPSCRKNLEPSESSSVDEIGSLLNPPALPAAGARSLFNFNSQQNQFKRAPSGEPYEVTPPPQFAQSQQQQQFFSPQPFPKISQPVHFPLPFFGQQNPFQNRFQASFQPQFTFLPQQQPQPQPIAKENKVTFPETPFNQQPNKGMVQLVYVPIEALQRQKPRFQSDRPVSQQSTLDTKPQASFDSDKLRFQRPPLPVEQTKNRFQLGQDPGRFQVPPQTFAPETNRFPTPPSAPSFIQDSGRLPSPPAEQNVGRFSAPLPSFEQGINTFSPSQSFEQNTGNFIPPSQIFNQEKPAFITQTKDSRPQQFLPQNEQSTSPLSFQFSEDARNPPSNIFQFHSRFQKPQIQEENPKETQSQVQQKFVPNFEDSSKESSQNVVPVFDSSRPTQEAPQNVIPNFLKDKPRTEQSPQFIPINDDQSLRSQQQLPANFQDRPPQDTAQQTLVPNFEFRPRPENQEFIPNFQDTRLKQESVSQTFSPGFEDIRPKPRPKVQTSTFPTPPQIFSSPNSIEETFTPTTYPPAHQPPLSVYMEKRLDNKVNEVLSILKDAKTIPVLDTIGDHSPKVFVGPSDLDAPRGYVKFELPYLSSLDISKIETMVDSLPFFVAPLNFKPPIGYSKIPFPPPHIGSVVVSSKSPAVVTTSTEFVPFTLTPQLPTEVNSLKPISSTQREFAPIERVKPTTTVISPTKRNRQRKPIHRGSLTSFSTTTPLNDVPESQRDQFTTLSELQRLPENIQSTVQYQFVENTPTPIEHQFSDFPKKSIEQQQQSVFESSPTPVQKFETNQPQFFSEQQVPQQFSDTVPQLNQPQFFGYQEQPQSIDQSQKNQQTSLENQQQPVQQELFDNVSQFVTEETLKTQSVPEVSTQEPVQQQFLPSTTEKQVHKNFQSVQSLSQYNPHKNQVQHPSTTEQVQTASPISQTPSDEPQPAVSTGLPKYRQRLSYYDKVILSSTESPVESTSIQNTIETSEKPRERQKLRPRQRLTTTRRPSSESKPSEENSEHVTESSSTQRYNPLRRRRPITSTEASEPATRSSFRSRTTQANRPDFVRSRSRRPLSTTTTTTTTTEIPRTEQYENSNDVQTNGQDEQKKIEEAASFWNEPVTIQQSQGYELGSYTSDGSKFSSGEPPSDEVITKEKHNDKKAYDPNNEKKTPGRRGHWVRVKVKKPQDNLDTAESQNSLGPLSANAIHEMITKPSAPAENNFPSSAMSELTTTTTTKTTTSLPPTSSESTAFTTVSPPLTTTMMSEYTMEGVTEYHPAETTMILSSSTSAPIKNVDDEQDEVFQRNLADMLAKFINNPQQDQHQLQETSMAPTIVEEITSERLDEIDMDTTVPPTTTVTEILNSDQITSTTTKVSVETEICYKGRCVKSQKNKKITDLLPEP
ncbi:mucin-17-like [Daktulosphaira vitifoliae]|uniref:mucin-17-like n=1 Tax=Daktulosphaira vitifoliae TaxID=58002 RepID=UPI0021AA83E3|nr:mucin-17-like [Daktulosphaira vitifoliae]XP_050540593.1 mucin-17-like [Daktulosphaira vitifoliae]